MCDAINTGRGKERVNVRSSMAPTRTAVVVDFIGLLSVRRIATTELPAAYLLFDCVPSAADTTAIHLSKVQARRMPCPDAAVQQHIVLTYRCDEHFVHHNRARAQQYTVTHLWSEFAHPGEQKGATQKTLHQA